MSLEPEVRRGGGLPFGMVASRWMCDPRYSTNARTLYAILVTYADTRARDTAQGKPYRTELAAQLGASVSTVDRTLDELEAAGMVTVEHRTDPNRPLNNEANVYHLHDAGVMWQGNGEWTDPLPAGVKAADVAKALVEERRAKKREQGIVRKGGVPKGVNPKAVKTGREAPLEEGGGSMGAARGSSTDAAGVAAPMLPNVYSPVHNPVPDAAPDARRASTGSSARETGGFAASGKTSSATTLTREQRAHVDAVWHLLPAELAGGVPRHAHGLENAILEALAAGGPFERTAQQLVTHRVLPRWNGHWAAEWYASRVTSPVGALRAMLRRDPLCNDPRCDEHVQVDTGEPCRSCAGVREDHRANRATPPTSQAGQAADGETWTPPPYRAEPARPVVPPNEAARSIRQQLRAQKSDLHRKLNRTTIR